MVNRHSDTRWILQQAWEVFSWTGISWFVALFIGVWGAMIGIGAFFPAYIFLGICILLCVIKWGHATCIHTADRRTNAFIVGILLLVGISVSMITWTHGRKVQADEDARKMEPLKDIPGLKKQLEDLPGMKKTISDLQSSNKTATEAAQKKQEIIEGLAQTVIAQQKALAEKAHQDLSQATATLTTNINQYRTDTNSAVGRIMRPPRTLGDRRNQLVAELKKYPGQDVAITFANGSREARDFAGEGEIESAFKESGWNIVPTVRLGFIRNDGIGLRIVTKVLVDHTEIQDSDLTPNQLAVARAFFSIGMRADGNPMSSGDSGPVEVYIGLQ